MSVPINMKPKQPGVAEQMIPSVAGMVGNGVGSYFGGPAGGMVGGMAGGVVGQAATSSGTQEAPSVGQPGAADVGGSSNPRDRAMEQMQKDPVNQLQQGKAALSGMDEQDRVMLQPVLDEALKRAWQDKNKQQMSDTEMA